jgi:hypothetical protein
MYKDFSVHRFSSQKPDEGTPVWDLGSIFHDLFFPLRTIKMYVEGVGT